MLPFRDGVGRSESHPNRVAGPAIFRTMHQLRARVTSMQLGLSPRNLAFQALEHLQPNRLDRVVACGDVNVGAGDGEMHMRLHRGRGARHALQPHIGRGDGGQLLQILQSSVEPRPQAGAGRESRDLDLRSHDGGMLTGYVIHVNRDG